MSAAATGAMHRELEVAHARGVAAAVAGLQDAALRERRVSGPVVHTLAEAAVSSATPFLRAPLLSRISRVARLHPLTETAHCPTCQVSAPCPTALALQP